MIGRGMPSNQRRIPLPNPICSLVLLQRCKSVPGNSRRSPEVPCATCYLFLKVIHVAFLRQSWSLCALDAGGKADIDASCVFSFCEYQAKHGR